MFARLLLCLVLPVASMGCIELATNDPNATSGGNSTTGGTSDRCVTGTNFMKLNVSEESATNGIVSDPSGVYWVNDLGTVWHAGPKGTSPMPLASDLGDQLYTIALDADAVYVVDYATALFRIEKNSGKSSSLAMGTFVALAVDDSFVYTVGTGGITAVDKQGVSSPVSTSLSHGSSIAVDKDYIYLRTNEPESLARIWRVSKTNATAEELVPAELAEYRYFSQELAIDETHVYWVNPSAGTVSRVAKSGDDMKVLASGIADPVSITVDDAFAYFTVRGKDGGSTEDRAVAKVPKTGGTISYVAHGSQVSALGIAVDETNAYWTRKVTNGGVETACK